VSVAERHLEGTLPPLSRNFGAIPQAREIAGYATLAKRRGYGVLLGPDKRPRAGGR
jgi:hypothetical protein